MFVLTGISNGFLRFVSSAATQIVPVAVVTKPTWTDGIDYLIAKAALPADIKTALATKRAPPAFVPMEPDV